MRRNIKRIAIGMSAIMMLSSTVGNGNVISTSKAVKKESVSNYVIVKETNKMEQPTIITELLTEKEANSIADEANTICVEPDIELSGASVKKAKIKRVHKKIKENQTQWNMQMLNADKKVETINKKDDKIKVAIIDSGVDFSSDIDVAVRKNFIPGEEEVSILYEDGSGHGTSVAGIIAAKDNGEGITGVNENVELYSAKVLDANNSAPLSRVIEAINWAIEQDVDIINMSFGTDTYSAVLENAVNRAKAKGILLIASAGNGGNVEYPAAYEAVMAVGSVGADGIISEESSIGERIDITAPGEQITSTGAFDGVMVSGGTSMAAPHVAGVASVLWQKNKDVPAEFIKQLICSSAKNAGDEKAYGSGIVDLQYALESYDEAWEAYQENPNGTEEVVADIVESNEEAIECFDNVNTVEGRWYGTDHKDVMNKFNFGFTKQEIKVVKAGLAYPDKNVKTKGLGENPYWHGGYKCSNYISSYIYATNMALALKNKKKLSTAEQPKGIGLVEKTNMLMVIENLEWSELLTKVTKKNKCLFVWGMAIHNAMDVYAHSVTANVSGSWEHLDHPYPIKKNPKNGLADEIGEGAFPGRYKTACLVAKKSLNTYIAGKKGQVSDFNPSGAYAYVGAGTNWKVIGLSENANIHDTKIGLVLKKYSASKNASY